MLLKDKVVLVINAELPLGQAIAIDCARHGAHVAINADPSLGAADTILSAIAAHGRRGFCIEGEAVEAQGAEALVASVVEALGRVDVLINCMPCPLTADAAPSTPADVFRRAMSVGVTGVYAALQAAARRMIAQGGGAIIAVNGQAADTGRSNAVTGSEMEDLMEMWAETLRTDGVRCNAVRLDGADRFDDGPIALDELTGPVVFLASDLARNISGATLRVGEPAISPAIA